MPSTISDFLSLYLQKSATLPPNKRTVERNLRLYAIKTAYSPLFVLIVSLASLRLPLLQPSGFEHLSFAFLFFLPFALSFVQAACLIWLAPWNVVRMAPYGVPLLIAAFVAVVPTVVPEAIIMLLWVPEGFFEEHSYAMKFLGLIVSETTVACSALLILLFVLESDFQAILDEGDLNVRVLRWPEKSAPVEAPIETAKPDLENEQIQGLLLAPVRGAVLQIVAENKYIRVTTQNGEQLLSMSLTAAEEKLDPARGMRIHRSVWLAWDAMGRIIYENGNPRIFATTGTVHPISRKNVKMIRERQEGRDAAE